MGVECPKCHFDNPDDILYCGKCATPLPPGIGLALIIIGAIIMIIGFILKTKAS